MSRSIDSRGVEGTGSFNTEQLFIPTTYNAIEPVRSDFSVQTIFSTLYRYRILILAVTIATIVIAGFFTRKIDPTYQAQAMVSVGQYIPPILGQTGKLLRETTNDRNYIADQLPLITSYTIAELVMTQDEDIKNFIESGVIAEDILKNNPSATHSKSVDIEALLNKGVLEQADTELSGPNALSQVAVDSRIPLDYLKDYLELIDYEHVRNTSMIAVTAQSVHPAMAARIANVHAQTFIALVRAKLLDSARVNLKFLQERKTEAQKKAENVRQEMLEYAEDNNILVTVGAGGSAQDHNFGGYGNSAVGIEYRDITQALYSVTRERARAESEFRSMQSTANTGRFYNGQQDRSMTIELANKKAELKALKKSGFRNDNAYLETLDRQINLLEEIISADRKNELKDHEVRLRALRDQERMMQEEVEQLKERSVKDSKKMMRYSLLRQEDHASQQILEQLSQRLEEVYIHLNSNQSHVRMIDEARAPEFSKAQRDYLNLILGLILGPFMGIALAFALDLLDNTVRTVSDLQRVITVPLLGIIPRFTIELDEMIASNYVALPEGGADVENQQPADPNAPLAGLQGPTGYDSEQSPSVLVGGPSLAGAWSTDVRNKLDMPENEALAQTSKGESPTMTQNRPDANGSSGRTAVDGGSDTAVGNLFPDGEVGEPDNGTTLITSSSLVLVSAPHSIESEAFRNVRTCVTYGSSEKPPKLVLVTSGQKNDGKTTVACNLAISLAQVSERTLLIDADLRIPAIHKNFSLSRLTPGLSDYLRGFRDYGEVIFETPIPNLCLMLSGEPCPNPTELVGSKKMGEMLELLSDEFDHIIIDSPPVTRVADAMLLSRLVEGVVLVVRSGKTPEPVAENAFHRLRQMDANILGTVLNDVIAVPGYRDAEYYYLSESYYGAYGAPEAEEEEEGYSAPA